MSSRYDPVDETEPGTGATPARSPLEPPPVVSKRQLWTTVAAIVIAAAVAVAGAFGFDLCKFCASVGVQLDACAAKPVAPTAPATSPAAQ